MKQAELNPICAQSDSKQRETAKHKIDTRAIVSVWEVSREVKRGRSWEVRRDFYLVWEHAQHLETIYKREAEREPKKVRNVSLNSISVFTHTYMDIA
jgi:hypothetical protein